MLKRIFSIDKTSMPTHNIINFLGLKLKYKVYNKQKSKDDEKNILNYLDYKKTRKAKSVVYTCVTNGYDNIEDIKAHKYINKDWDYVCFTDNKKHIKTGRVGIWEIRPLQFDKLDNTRNQRWHKIHPHVLFPEYESSLWIDGNVNLLTNKIFDLINNAKERILLPTHSKNICIYDEYDDVRDYNLDKAEIIDKQLEYITRENMPRNYGFTETNILYRIHSNSEIAQMMDEWWWFIENYSKRDQLSFQYVIWKHNILTSDISFNYDRKARTDFFVFPHRKNSRRRRRKNK